MAMGDAYCVDYYCRHVDNNSQQHTWDINNNLSILNSSSHISLLGMDERMMNTPPYFGTLGGYDYDTTSGGYLDDIMQLFDYGNSTKRRKLLLYPPPHQDSTSLLNHTSTHIIGPALSTCSWESIRSSRKSGVTIDQESMILPSPKQANYNWPLEDTFSSSVVKDIDSNLFSMPNCQENNNGEIRMMKKKKKMRSTKRSLVYPFALVKPGGEEGDVTLNDINERLLMPPTRPIPHPVGHFASVSKPHGPGLSGKPVVALTTIRTLGTGTITIIRTKD